MTFLEELRADHNKRSSSRQILEEDSVRLMVRKLIYEPMKLAIREEAHRTFSDHFSGDYLIGTEYYGRISPVPAHVPFWDSEFIDDSEVLHLHPLCTVKSSRIFGITATASLTSAGRQVIDILSELASADGIPVTFFPAIGNIVLQDGYYLLSQFDVSEKVPRDRINEMLQSGYSMERLLSTCGVVVHYEIDL